MLVEQNLKHISVIVSFSQEANNLPFWNKNEMNGFSAQNISPVNHINHTRRGRQVFIIYFFLNQLLCFVLPAKSFLLLKCKIT